MTSRLSLRQQLAVAALGADLGARGQEELVRRFGKDFCADVAAFEDASAPAAEVLLEADQDAADGGNGGDVAGGHAHLGRADERGDVFAVEQHARRLAGDEVDA